MQQLTLPEYQHKNFKKIHIIEKMSFNFNTVCILKEVPEKYPEGNPV